MSEIPWIMEFNMKLLLGDIHSNLKFEIYCLTDKFVVSIQNIKPNRWHLPGK